MRRAVQVGAGESAAQRTGPHAGGARVSLDGSLLGLATQCTYSTLTNGDAGLMIDGLQDTGLRSSSPPPSCRLSRPAPPRPPGCRPPGGGLAILLPVPLPRLPGAGAAGVKTAPIACSVLPDTAVLYALSGATLDGPRPSVKRPRQGSSLPLSRLPSFRGLEAVHSTVTQYRTLCCCASTNVLALLLRAHARPCSCTRTCALSPTSWPRGST